MSAQLRRGPLAGLRVLELGGVGPIPFCGMYFADMGADVIRIERPLGDDALSRSRASLNLAARGKRTVALDIRVPEGRRLALDLAARSDVVMEGFRPGVLERLRLGPDDCLEVNPRVVFARMTGWGSGGPLSTCPAHDINYIGLAGLLSTIGTPDQPIPPLNIVGDFGGALYLVTGVLSALVHARSGGQGQVVEASILGGSLGLMAQLFAIHDHGDWLPSRQSNWMDGGAPFYRAYRTLDGGYMAVGAVEPQFYRALLGLLGVAKDIDPLAQMDRATWPATIARFAAVFATRSRAVWSDRASEVEACCTPVLDLDEAREHPQVLAADLLVDVGGRREPAPQPKFSATPTEIPVSASPRGGDALGILKELGRSEQDIDALFASKVVSRPI